MIEKSSKVEKPANKERVIPYNPTADFIPSLPIDWSKNNNKKLSNFIYNDTYICIVPNFEKQISDLKKRFETVMHTIYNTTKYTILGDNVITKIKGEYSLENGYKISATLANLSSEYYVGDRFFLRVSNLWNFFGYVKKVIQNADGTTTIEAGDYKDKLKTAYIRGSAILESTMNVYNAIVSLKPHIEKVGIIFDEEAMGINRDFLSQYTLTTSFSGKNVFDILDECMDACPPGARWFIDKDRFFVDIKIEDDNDFEIVKNSTDLNRVVSWYNGDFESSEYEESYDDLVTGYVVSRKIFNSDEFETLPKIVGEDIFEPPYFVDEIGKVIGNFEYPYSVSNDDVCYSEVNNRLQRQRVKKSIKVKNADLRTYNYRALNGNNEENYYTIVGADRVVVVGSPDKNFIVDIDVYQKFSLIGSGMFNYKANGNIYYVNEPLNEAALPREIVLQEPTIDLRDVDMYYNLYCNYTKNIQKITVLWEDLVPDRNATKCLFKATDGVNEVMAMAENNRVVLDVRGFNKRAIKILSELDGLLFKKMRCYFDEGSKVAYMTPISQKLELEAKQFKLDIEYEQVYQKTKNWFFDKDQQIKKLQTLFNS